MWGCQRQLKEKRPSVPCLSPDEFRSLPDPFASTSAGSKSEATSPALMKRGSFKAICWLRGNPVILPSRLLTYGGQSKEAGMLEDSSNPCACCPSSIGLLNSKTPPRCSSQYRDPSAIFQLPRCGTHWSQGGIRAFPDRVQARALRTRSGRLSSVVFSTHSGRATIGSASGCRHLTGYGRPRTPCPASPARPSSASG